MLGSYRKNIYVPYTRDIDNYLKHLANKPDETTIPDLLRDMKELIKPEGLDNCNWSLLLVWRENAQPVDATWTLKELRTYPIYTFEYKMFITTNLSINPFIV